MNQKNTELLLPCGNYQMALAAIHNGADAIYVGMPGFNARGRSHDHEFDELKEIIEICHLYNVDVHLAFNILIFENELDKAVESLKKVLLLAPDALIVQDIGLIRIINSLAPKQVVHGSTQMTVTNHEAIELLDDLNIQRFVLGRENSITEIKAIREHTQKELEVFVHGALCVAYSGQCFTSEALGGRSANRGQCAQSCRFEYELIVDGQTKKLGDFKYLVSPKDLCGINDIPKLVDIGIESFKVEGRLKSPEFVASVASSYRKAIDDFESLNKEYAINNMAITYSRGFFNGWLDGVAHQKLVDGTFGSNRGLYLGEVNYVTKKHIRLKTDVNLFAGDGVLITLGEVQVGGPIFEATKMGQTVELGFSKNLDLSKIKPGFKVYLNSREKLYKDLKKSFTDKNLLKKIPIDVNLLVELGKPLKLTVTEGKTKISCTTEDLVEQAQNRELTQEQLLDGVKGLSHSPYKIKNFHCDLSDGLYINNKAVKQLKQKMVEQLNQARLKRQVEITHILPQLQKKDQHNSAPMLTVLIRRIEQLEDLLHYFSKNFQYQKHLKMVVLDYEFGKDFVKSVKMAKEAGLFVTIATTRILKPDEYHNFRLIERANPDGLLIRNLGALNYFKNSSYKLFGDFSLNITNSYTFDYLLNKGFETLCLSYDLNNDQLKDVLKNIDVSSAEITAHQYMPEFHMEHCVFAAFLSEGNSFRDCGKPCEKHHVQLKDMYGNMHELKADQECRNTMFNAKSMSAATLIPQWQELGVVNFRFEALHEVGEDFINKIQTYLKLISGEYTSEEVFTKIGNIENYGVTTGQLLHTKKYKDRKKL